MAKTAGGIRGNSNKNHNKAPIHKSKSAFEKIKQVFADIQEYGFSKAKPFAVGRVESAMTDFANENQIEVASKSLYMTVKQLTHATRASKAKDNLVVSVQSIMNFPKERRKMELYYEREGNIFIYTDKTNKFIIHPNYKIKTAKGKVKVVNFITAGRVTDYNEFNQKRYEKIR